MTELTWLNLLYLPVVALYDRWPNRLYKFTEARYARDLVNSGIFRIGTLSGYGATEKMPDDIADACEGTSILRDSRRGIQTEETMGWAMRQVFKVQPGGGNKFHNVNIRLNVDEDFYVYCLHESNKRSVAASPKYDACVEIDALPFVQVLSRALHLGQAIVGRCRYVGRDHEIGGDDPPMVPLLKPTRFEYQCEWRFLWQCRLKQQLKHST